MGCQKNNKLIFTEMEKFKIHTIISKSSKSMNFTFQLKK